MQTCTRCVMDQSAAEITFDENGVCNFCHEFAKANEDRLKEKSNLPWLYEEIREAGRGHKYDCILGLSGGVDSAMCLYYLIQNGIRPLCFSVDNGWNTAIADENIMRLVESMKVPFERHVIHLGIFRSLQSAFAFSGIANIEIPTDHVLMAKTYELANKYNIKYIISGGNLATEGIMPKSWGYNARDLKFIKSVYSKVQKLKLRGLPTIHLIEYLYYRFIKRIQVINLLDYYEYHRQQSIELLTEKFGYQDYGEKHGESVFTRWFQLWYLPIKFGFNKKRPHYSSMINSGQMTRDDAMKKEDTVGEQYNFILFRTPEEENPTVEGMAERILAVPNKTYKDYPNSEWAWNLLSRIYSWLK